MADDDLVGAAEVAEMLGVTRARVNQLARDGELPEPAATVSAGRIWRRQDVEEWARATGRLH